MISPLHQRLKSPPALWFEAPPQPGLRPLSPVAAVSNKVFLACLTLSRAIFALAEGWATPGGRGHFILGTGKAKVESLCPQCFLCIGVKMGRWLEWLLLPSHRNPNCSQSHLLQRTAATR